MSHHSLRRSIAAGAVAWTLGLLIVASAALAALVEQHRGAAPLVHGVLAHTPIVVLMAVGLLLTGVWFVRRAVSPLADLRQRLLEVQHGTASRVAGTYPSEVQPLVDDLNALVAHRDEALRRAQARAGDLAHGLKTPLAVLSVEVGRLVADGRLADGSALDEQLARMRRQIDYQLAHARAAASGAAGRSGGSILVAPVAAALVRALERLHAERRLSIEVEIGDGDRVRCQREDLEEMLGNLMDNACKWARQQVRVTAQRDRDSLALMVEDDGPGLEPEQLQEALGRGRRLDEAVPGWGLGLAITRDLVELHDGEMTLDRSPLGGVAVRLRLPAPAPSGPS